MQDECPLLTLIAKLQKSCIYIAKKYFSIYITEEAARELSYYSFNFLTIRVENFCVHFIYCYIFSEINILQKS